METLAGAFYICGGARVLYLWRGPDFLYRECRPLATVIIYQSPSVVSTRIKTLDSVSEESFMTVSII